MHSVCYSGAFLRWTTMPAVKGLPRLSCKAREKVSNHSTEGFAPRSSNDDRVAEFDCFQRSDEISYLATVLRQSRFMPLASAAALVAGLEGECALKQDGRKAIGFV